LAASLPKQEKLAEAADANAKIAEYYIGKEMAFAK
jgi:hypothetical protein